MNKISKVFPIFSLAIIFLLALINLFTLKDGHHWGDFAQYIVHAKNILTQRSYIDGITVSDVGIVYPPGFPLLLAPLYKMFGVNFIVFKLLNILFWNGHIFFLYQILSRRLDKTTALLFSMFVAASFYYFMFKQAVLSDVPFVFFATGSFYFMMRYEESGESRPQRTKYLILLLVFMTISYLLRAVGLMLFVSCLFYLLLVRRDWRTALGVALCLILTIGLQTWIKGGVHAGLLHPNIIKKIFHSDLIKQFSILNNLALVFKGFAYALYPAKGKVGEALFSVVEKTALFLSVALIVGFLVMWTNRLIRRSLSWMECFIVFYVIILFLWTVFGDIPEHFARYMFPLWMPVFIVVYEGLSFIGERVLRLKKIYAQNLLRACLVVLTLLNIGSMVAFFDFNDDLVYHPDRKEVYAWMNENMPPDAHYLFPDDPRPVALFTGRSGTAMWMIETPGSVDLNVLWMKFRELKITYWVMSRSKDESAIQFFGSQPGLMELVWENESFKIFKLK